jgi:hypothetical protein
MFARLIGLMLVLAIVAGASAAPAPMQTRTLRLKRDRLKRAVEQWQRAFRNGSATFDEVLALSEKLLRAELALADTEKQRRATYEANLQLAQRTADIARERNKAGTLRDLDYARAVLAVAQAEEKVAVVLFRQIREQRLKELLRPKDK